MSFLPVPSNGLERLKRHRTISNYFELFRFWAVFTFERFGTVQVHGKSQQKKHMFFPTCQVRVVRFYVSCLVLLLLVLLLLSLSSSSSCSTATRDPQCSLSDLNHDHPRPVFPAGPQPRPSTPSVPCRTSTASIHAQCSLPDLNHDHPRPVFPAGPQPRPSTPSVPCRTSTASIHAKCSLPDLM